MSTTYTALAADISHNVANDLVSGINDRIWISDGADWDANLTITEASNVITALGGLSLYTVGGANNSVSGVGADIVEVNQHHRYRHRVTFKTFGVDGATLESIRAMCQSRRVRVIVQKNGGTNDGRFYLLGYKVGLRLTEGSSQLADPEEFGHTLTFGTHESDGTEPMDITEILITDYATTLSTIAALEA